MGALRGLAPVRRGGVRPLAGWRQGKAFPFLKIKNLFKLLIQCDA